MFFGRYNGKEGRKRLKAHIRDMKRMEALLDNAYQMMMALIPIQDKKGKRNEEIL